MRFFLWIVREHDDVVRDGWTKQLIVFFGVKKKEEDIVG